MEPSDDDLRRIFARTKVVACVGLSTDPVRPSYYVGRYLSLKGFTVIGVNPAFAGERLFGQVIVPDIASIPASAQVDFVDVFRRSEAVPGIVDAALSHLQNLKTIWMQVGVRHAEAAARAEAAGITVIQNRCPKIEYQRLCGELRMAGFNTRIISSKRPA
jgi:predicted CoA-binding protein